MGGIDDAIIQTNLAGIPAICLSLQGLSNQLLIGVTKSYVSGLLRPMEGSMHNYRCLHGEFRSQLEDETFKSA